MLNGVFGILGLLNVISSWCGTRLMHVEYFLHHYDILKGVKAFIYKIDKAVLDAGNKFIRDDGLVYEHAS